MNVMFLFVTMMHFWLIIWLFL